MHRLNPNHPAPLVSGRFLLRLSRIKHSQVISIGKFGPTALNFGKDFFLLLVTLFWDTLYCDLSTGLQKKLILQARFPDFFVCQALFLGFEQKKTDIGRNFLNLDGLFSVRVA